MNNIYEDVSLPIKKWSEQDRPREKLLELGRQSLTNAELIAAVIRSGSKTESAVSLARKILKFFDDDLSTMGKIEAHDLISIPGIGLAKAAAIVASFELGRRHQFTPVSTKPKLNSSKKVYTHMGGLLGDLRHEEFWILLLNKASNLISKEKLSSGGLSGTMVDARVVFKKALEQYATAIILVHNHPSGNLQPSESDRQITHQLSQAGSLLDIPVLDHLIIGDRGYFSFADEDIL